MALIYLITAADACARPITPYGDILHHQITLLVKARSQRCCGRDRRKQPVVLAATDSRWKYLFSKAVSPGVNLGIVLSGSARWTTLQGNAVATVVACQSGERVRLYQKLDDVLLATVRWMAKRTKFPPTRHLCPQALQDCGCLHTDSAPKKAAA